MSTPFVTFPGTSGNYIDSSSVNLLGADHAHVVQSQPYGATRCTVADGGIQADGWGQVDVEITAVSSAARMNGTVSIPISADTYYLSCSVDNKQGTDREMNVQYITDVETVSSDTVVVPAGVSRPMFTMVLQAGTISAIRVEFLTTGASIGDLYEVSKLTLADVSDGTFVPSLRIVGDLDLRANIAPDDATPTASQYLLNNASGSDGYGMYLHTDGKIYVVNGDGSTNREDASDALTWTDGDTHLVKYTMDVSSGATAFYLDGVAAGTGSETAAASSPSGGSLLVGAATASTLLFDGDIYYVEIRDGIGGPVVARMDAADVASAV